MLIARELESEGKRHDCPTAQAAIAGQPRGKGKRQIALGKRQTVLPPAGILRTSGGLAGSGAAGRRP
jgi:hypothetical protein